MTTSPWTGGRLIAASAILTCAGIVLLYAGLRPQTVAPAPRPSSAAVHAASPDTSAGKSPAAAAGTVLAAAPSGTADSAPASSPTSAATAVAAGGPSELPHPGSGEAADPLIQQVMDKASPSDLPPADEALLLRQGCAAWLAETARYTRVRIQAATARRDTTAADGGPGRALVRLVWAGADPAGTFLDGRPGAVHFTQNGDGSWNRMR